MKLSDDELRHLENLARIRLGGESREKLREQLARIIDFVRQLQKTDTSGYSSKKYADNLMYHLRDDEVAPCLSRDEVLAESPESDGGFFKVPHVMDDEGS